MPLSLVVSAQSIQYEHIHGLVQDCSISSADALEILQSCTNTINIF